MEVIIRYGKTHSRFSRLWVVCVLRTAMKVCKQKGNVGVYFSNNAEIAKYNKKYRGINKATDVLSFEGAGGEQLGDIIISVEYVAQHTKHKRGALTKEIGTLLIHGVLHLCGFDHMKSGEAKKMFSLQNSIARKVGANELTDYPLE